MSIKIRQASAEDASAVATVHIAAWRSAYRGIVCQSYLDALSHDRRCDNFRQRALDPKIVFLVAQHESSGIVGFTTAGMNRDNKPADRAEIYTIYILPEFQRKGVGRMLMRKVFHELRGRGFSSAHLWALRDNASAKSFYRAIGGRESGSRLCTIDQLELPEVAFQWDHLGT